MSVKIEERTAAVIAEIKARLETVEEYMAWLIVADKRFRVGQDTVLPPSWKWIWQSAVCPECQVRVERDGGYNVVKGGSYADGREDPRKGV